MSDQGLERTGKFCGGLIADIKRRKPYYVDDYLQGCNPKVMASTIFMYFACLANAVCLLYTSPSPRDRTRSRMPSSA